MLKNTLYCCLFALCSMLNSCGCNHAHTSDVALLQEGDILFQDIDCGNLCTAIKAVTNGVAGKKFTHCALVVKLLDTLKVIEAIGDDVQINTLYNFLKRTGETNELKNCTVGRLKNEYSLIIKNAVSYAKEQLGKPYDNLFKINNGRLYCSELLYEAFKSANNNIAFFELQPMTFKEPKTNSYFSAWVDYYKLLNSKIPEGELGTNPGLISFSNKLNIINQKKIQCN